MTYGFATPGKGFYSTSAHITYELMWRFIFDNSVHLLTHQFPAISTLVLDMLIQA